MQVVNDKIKILALLLFFIGLTNGCHSVKKRLIHTSNRGGYKLAILKNSEDTGSSEILISGKVLDINSNKPIVGAEIIVGCKKYLTSTAGLYSFSVRKSDFLYLTSSFIGYKKIETELLDVNRNNALKIDFYLEEDNRPMINCE